MNFLWSRERVKGDDEKKFQWLIYGYYLIIIIINDKYHLKFKEKKNKSTTSKHTHNRSMTVINNNKMQWFDLKKNVKKSQDVFLSFFSFFWVILFSHLYFTFTIFYYLIINQWVVLGNKSWWINFITIHFSKLKGLI